MAAHSSSMRTSSSALFGYPSTRYAKRADAGKPTSARRYLRPSIDLVHKTRNRFRWLGR